MSKLAEAAVSYADSLKPVSRCGVCRLRTHLPADELADLDQLLFEIGDNGKRVWSGKNLAALLNKHYGTDVGVTRGMIENHRSQGH